MKNRERIKLLLVNLTGHDNVILAPKPFVMALGSLNEAVILNQIIYNGDYFDGWFAKTYQQWEEELGLSQYIVSKAIKKLESLGLVQTEIRKMNGAPTVHYLPIIDEIADWIMKFLDNGKSSFLIMDNEVSQQSLENEVSSQTIKREEDKNKEKDSPHVLLYSRMREKWKQLFPNKPQPKKGTYLKKVTTRMKDQGFIEQWEQAMVNASKSPTYQSSSWFDFAYFVRSEETWNKCLNKFMEWKDKELRSKSQRKQQSEFHPMEES